MLYKETSAFPCHALSQTDTETLAKKPLPVENNVRGKKKMGCEGRAGFQMGMLDAFDTGCNKTDACGSTGGELGNVLLSLGITGASCRS